MMGLNRPASMGGSLQALAGLRGVVAQRLAAGTGPRPALFIARTQRSFVSDPDLVAIPGGSQLGDLVIMVTNTDLTSGFAPTKTNGWVLVDTLSTITGYQQTVWVKVLSATDLSNGSFQVANTHPGNGVTCLMVYRNVTSVNIRGKSSNSSGAAMDFAFSPQVPSKGLILCGFNRLGEATGWGVAGKWAPYSNARANFPGTGFYCFVADVLLTPPVPPYDGATVTFDIPVSGDTGAQFLEII